MKRFKLFFFVVVFVGLLVGGYTVLAQDNSPDIDYPVAELGNCANEQECRTYCDNVAHFSECIAFAEAHNLLTPQELAEAKRFEQFGVESGPGGCVSERECKAYCEDISHLDECLTFAEEHDILDDLELDEARKVASALRQGAQLPGGCTNKAECEAYCEESSHIEECLAFAEAAGFMSPDELEGAKRIAPLMARGETPGGCRSREQCETYCAQDQNTEECIEFFQTAGFMTAEEAEMFRKTGGKGPGGCQGEQECEAFCNNPANQEVCFEFAKEHGLIPEDEIGNLEEGIQKFHEGFHSAPPEVAHCLRDTIGEDVLSKIEAGTFLPNPQMGDHMRRCFEDFLPQGPEGDHGGGPGPQGIPPEAQDCVQRILGDLSGPPSSDQEERIKQECFPQQPDEFGDDHGFPGSPDDHERFDGSFPPDGEFRPDEFREEFEQRQIEEFERQFHEEAKHRFEEEFQKQIENIPEGFRPSDGAGIPTEFQDFLKQPIVPGIEPPTSEIHKESAPPSSGDGTQAEPQTRLPREGFFGAVIDAVEPSLKRWLPFLPL